jgi:ATP-dependent Clp protease ATP-binding subunit ClpA
MEELAQNEYMDFVSELRYQIARMCEGQFYVHLLSDMDILKREVKEMKKAFWNDPERSANYTNFMAMQERVEKHRATIEELEMQMALSSMGMQGINTKLYEQIKAWNKEFFNVKLDLYRLLDKDADKIGLGLYLNPKKEGDLLRLLSLYLPACEAKEFDCKVESVWYRESLYNETEELEVDEFEFVGEEMLDAKIISTTEEEGQPKRYTIRRPKKVYFKKFYDAKDHKKSLRPEQKEDKLVGLELIIKGPGANLYFAHETMIHAFEYEQEKFEYFYLQTFENEIFTPKDLLKKDFAAIQRKPRRKYALRRITDSEFDFPKNEVHPEQYATAMQKIWQKLFENHLNELVK